MAASGMLARTRQRPASQRIRIGRRGRRSTTTPASRERNGNVMLLPTSLTVVPAQSLRNSLSTHHRRLGLTLLDGILRHQHATGGLDIRLPAAYERSRLAG